MTDVRRQAYRLFGHLYLRGLTPDTLEAVQAIPDLAAPLPPVFSPDEAAADHFALFGLHVPPYAGLFLDETGRLGGSTAEEMASLFRRDGFVLASTSEPPDHLGHALTFLAETTSDTQQHFLRRHLLWWLPAFALAVRRQGFPFYTALSELTLDLVFDHLGEPQTHEATCSLPWTPVLTDDPGIGLREIARFLTIPSRCGLWLSRGDITRLARATKQPHGFGDRHQTILNLLRTAVSYDGLETTLDVLLTWTEAEQTAYDTFTAAGLPSSMAAAWKDRLTGTLQFLDHVRTAVLD